MTLRAVDLVAFEQDVAEAFNAGKIRAPVHLAGGNEDELIAIFKDVRPADWVLTQWRSHYHCLLKGVPRAVLMADILAGKSITLCYPSHLILSSAIVGGTLPIALGLAWSIKRQGGADRVWVFCGDMTARTGIFDEVSRYAAGHDLPLRLVVEGNGKSVCTDTNATWGGESMERLRPHSYFYTLPWPHSGAGKRVEF